MKNLLPALTVCLCSAAFVACGDSRGLTGTNSNPPSSSSSSSSGYSGTPGVISIHDTPIGWATENGGTTGGGTDLGSAVTVSTMSELQRAVTGSGKKIVLVTPGTYVGELSPGANTTIIGTAPDVTISGNLAIRGRDKTNIIIRNLAVRGLSCSTYRKCRAGDDAVYIGSGASNIWLDHLDVADGQDGNLDVTRKGDFITISWSKFHYTSNKEHRFSNLIASNDRETRSRGKLKITYTKCWWGNLVDSRQPRGRFGKIHMLNNYHNTGGNQIHGVGLEMSLIAENNYYDEPGQSIFTNMGSPTGWLGTGNEGSALNMNDSMGTVFEIPYDYTAMPASQVKDVVTATACGAGNNCELEM